MSIPLRDGGAVDDLFSSRIATHIIHCAEPLQQELVHFQRPWGEATGKPLVVLDLFHADPAGGVCHQGALQYVNALRTHVRMLQGRDGASALNQETLMHTLPCNLLKCKFQLECSYTSSVEVSSIREGNTVQSSGRIGSFVRCRLAIGYIM